MPPSFLEFLKPILLHLEARRFHDISTLRDMSLGQSTREYRKILSLPVVASCYKGEADASGGWTEKPSLRANASCKASAALRGWIERSRSARNLMVSVCCTS